MDSFIEEEASEVPEVSEAPEVQQEPIPEQEANFEPEEVSEIAAPIRKRGRPRMTPEQKKEAKAARNRLKVVSAGPKSESTQKKEQKPKIIERVIREYVEVPVPATQQSPFESIGNVLRSRAISDYERKKQQWASFQII